MGSLDGGRPGAGPTVSVVVAVRGNIAALEGLAAAVHSQSIGTEIELIVVDNHQVPALAQGAVRLGPMACRVVHEPVPGLSQARNTGIRASRGDFVLITDPDARPTAGWAAAMVRALESTGAYMAGGRVVPRFTGTSLAGMSPELLQWFVPPRWPDVTVELAAPYWVVGCNLGFRRLPQPRFDTRLGVVEQRHLSCEEWELAVRAQRDGLRVVVVPDAVVHRAIHPADLTTRAVAARAWWHGVSVARLLAIHPDAEIYDSDRLRDTVTRSRLGRRAGWQAAMADVLRIVGLRVERRRLSRTGLPALAEDPSTATRQDFLEGIDHG